MSIHKIDNKYFCIQNNKTNFNNSKELTIDLVKYLLPKCIKNVNNIFDHSNFEDTKGIKN